MNDDKSGKPIQQDHTSEHMGTPTDIAEDDSVMNSNHDNDPAMRSPLTTITPRMDTAIPADDSATEGVSQQTDSDV